MSVLNFKIGGVETIAVDATSNFTTDNLNTESSDAKSFSVTLSPSGITGTGATYTLQVSNEGDFWYDLDKDVDAITTSTRSNFIGYRFMRVVYTAGSVTAGLIKLQLGLFKN